MIEYLFVVNTVNSQRPMDVIPYCAMLQLTSIFLSSLLRIMVLPMTPIIEVRKEVVSPNTVNFIIVIFIKHIIYPNTW